MPEINKEPREVLPAEVIKPQELPEQAEIPK